MQFIIGWFKVKLILFIYLRKGFRYNFIISKFIVKKKNSNKCVLYIINLSRKKTSYIIDAFKIPVCIQISINLRV